MIKNLDIIEKGYYEVYVNDIKVSQHTKPLKAASRAQLEKDKDGTADVYVKQPNLEPIVDTESVIVDISILEARISELEAENTTLTNNTANLNIEIEILLAEVERLKAIIEDGNVEEPPKLVKAFPSAYGGGALATGGRGGNVYHVTTVIDSGDEGSLRWALEQPRPATIVFDVSGVMELKYSLTVEGDDLTVLGQTAPQGKFIIAIPPAGNLNFSFGGWRTFQNQIWRYITIRSQFYGDKSTVSMMPGYGTYHDSSNTEPDYGRNLIFDHLSLGWSNDEVFNFRGDNTENITLQNSILAESVRGSLFGDTSGFEIPMSRNNTFRNNVLYHLSHRLPNINGVNVEVYNNVIYDWKQRLTVSTNGTKLNHFNNYYYKGTRTNISFSWNGDPINTRWYVNGITYKTDDLIGIPANELHTNPNTNIKIYSKNNVIQDFYDGTQEVNDKYIWMHHAGVLPDGTPIIPDNQQKFKASDEMFTDTMFPVDGIYPTTFLTAEETKTIVPEEAGANKYLNGDGTYSIYRDEADQHYRDAIINDTAEPWEVNSSAEGKPSAQDSQIYKNFVASITDEPTNTRSETFYVSNPHIPEAYLNARGIIGDANVHNIIMESGYTLLEEYANVVDENI
jgi:hypothetical protein